MSYNCRSSLVCPKPRRRSIVYQAEVSDAKAGSELMDIILSKGERSTTQVASSPPFFSGSPPSRVSNPLIQDARFIEEKQLVPPFSPLAMMSSSPIPVTSRCTSSPNSSIRKAGYVRPNFGSNPVVRVEGFDCLDMDRRSCGILTRA